MTPTPTTDYSPIYIFSIVLLIVTQFGRPAARWMAKSFKPKPPELAPFLSDIAGVLNRVYESIDSTDFWTDMEDRFVTAFLTYYEDFHKRADARAALASQLQNKNHLDTLTALEAIAYSLQQLSASQRTFVKSLFSGDGSGYSEMTDEKAELREQAEKLQRRYGISWEDAMERAKASLVYKPNGGMGAQA